MTDVIKPDEEAHVRLVVFGAALLAITVRSSTLRTDDMEVPVTPAELNPWAVTEAHAIVEAVLAEAKRLQSTGAP